MRAEQANKHFPCTSLQLIQYQRLRKKYIKYKLHPLKKKKKTGKLSENLNAKMFNI